MTDKNELPELVSEGLDYFEKSGDAGDKKYVQAIREYIATRAPGAVAERALLAYYGDEVWPEVWKRDMRRALAAALRGGA